MLYLVGLPVGNWEDMPKRNLEMLRNAKYLIIENFELFEIIKNKIDLLSEVEIIDIGSMGTYDTTKEPMATLRILDLLSAGEDVYVISDDGMPGIADPGEMITRETIKHGYQVSATPGPSAIIAAASVAGCQHNFSFEAFIPLDKKERSRKIQTKVYNESPMIFMLTNYTEGYRVFEVLQDMNEKWGNRNGVLCYNLTTNREKVIRGNLLDLIEYSRINTIIDYDMVMLVVDGKKPMLTMPEV